MKRTWCVLPRKNKDFSEIEHKIGTENSVAANQFRTMNTKIIHVLCSLHIDFTCK